MRYFEYVVMYHPPSENDDDSNASNPDTKMISDGVVRLLAKDERSVGMRAARSIPEEYVDKLDQVEIIIRSF